MANKRSNEPIVIIVRSKTKEEPPAAELSDEDAPHADPKKTGEGSRNLRRDNVLFAVTVASQAQTIILSEAQYSMSKYASLTDDYEYGVALENAKANLNMVGNVAQNMLSDAVVGAKAGGVMGAVVGAAVGLASGVTRIFVRTQQVLASQETQLNQQAYSLYYSTARAGLVNGSRYTEN